MRGIILFLYANPVILKFTLSVEIAGITNNPPPRGGGLNLYEPTPWGTGAGSRVQKQRIQKGNRQNQTRKNFFELKLTWEGGEKFAYKIK